jgi:hypothetical protein
VASTTARHLDGRVFALVRIGEADAHAPPPRRGARARDHVEPVWEPDAEPGILALLLPARP